MEEDRLESAILLPDSSVGGRQAEEEYLHLIDSPASQQILRKLSEAESMLKRKGSAYNFLKTHESGG